MDFYDSQNYYGNSVGLLVFINGHGLDSSVDGHVYDGLVFNTQGLNTFNKKGHYKGKVIVPIRLQDDGFRKKVRYGCEGEDGLIQTYIIDICYLAKQEEIGTL